jgi:hypothetical protein
LTQKCVPEKSQKQDPRIGGIGKNLVVPVRKIAPSLRLRKVIVADLEKLLW